MRSHAHPWFRYGTGTEPQPNHVRRLTFCPEHMVAVMCHAKALHRAWIRLKADHAAHCTRTDCCVNDAYTTISHGTAAMTADVVYMQRAQQWSA